MAELTKEEQLTDERLAKILSETQAVINERNAHCKTGGSVEVNARIFESMLAELQRSRQMLAGLEQDPVGEVVLGDYDDCGDYPDAKVVCIAAQGQADWNNFRNGTRLYAASQLPQPAVDDIGEISVGRLPTMNQDEYPGLGDWWVQLRIGEGSDEVLARVYGATPQEANTRAEELARRAAMLQGAEPVSQPDELPGDTRRLDWLDAQNKRLNEYYGTTYGWKFDANFQRNAMMLNDSNYPVMTVRQAIDEAIAAAPQQEAK